MNNDQIKIINWLWEQRENNIWISYQILMVENNKFKPLNEKDAICLFDKLSDNKLIKHQKEDKYLINKYANWEDYLFQIKHPFLFWIKKNSLSLAAIIISSIVAIFTISKTLNIFS